MTSADMERMEQANDELQKSAERLLNILDNIGKVLDDHGSVVARMSAALKDGRTGVDNSSMSD